MQPGHKSKKQYRHKNFRLSTDVIDKLKQLMNAEDRSGSNMVSVLINEAYAAKFTDVEEKAVV